MTSPADPDPIDPDPSEDSGDDAAIGVAFRRSLVIFAVIGLVAGGIWWANGPDASPNESVIVQAQTPEKRSIDLDEIPTVTMTDITDKSGIDFQHETGRQGEKLLPETMGSGVAVLDYDSDGNQDLFFVNSKYWPWDETAPPQSVTSRLFAGDGTGQFRDVTASTATAVDAYGMGVATADYDNDGDADVFLSAVGQNHLLRNDHGKFVDVTDSAGVGGAADAWSTSCGFADIDNDGDLDLFVCNYVTWDRSADLSQDFTLDGENRAYGPPRAFAGSFSYLYRNEGDGTFADISQTAGIQIRNSDTDVPLGKAMGLAPVDFNRDGWIDFVVANDTVRNFVFENQQDGTFAEVGQQCGIAYDRSGTARGAMGIDCDVFRPDGTLAISIGNFANEASALFMARPGRTQFVDAAMFTGFGPPTRLGLTFGLFFFDVDLDGRSDVLGANGHLEEEIAKTQTTQRYAQPPQLFWNAGPDAATELVQLTANHVGVDFFQPMVGRGAAFGDFDNDGDLDIVVSTSGGPAKLFRNDQNTGNHFLRLKLIGNAANRDAIGAVVTVKQGDRVTIKSVMPTRSYLSQCELPLTFGLGQDDSLPDVSVQWPGDTGSKGDVQTFLIDAIDKLIELRQAP